MILEQFPIHPGEILLEEYLKPSGLSAGAFAKLLGVPRTRIERIVAQETSLSTDTVLRLSRYFNTTPQYWINMQSGYDLRRALKNPPKNLDKIQPIQMQPLIAGE
jgi:antitoxin HigA-1